MIAYLLAKSDGLVTRREVLSEDGKPGTFQVPNIQLADVNTAGTASNGFRRGTKYCVE
jgi:hypothetical protein